MSLPIKIFIKENCLKCKKFLFLTIAIRIVFASQLNFF